MKRFFVVLCVLLVSACTTVNNPLTPNRLATLESSYGVLLSAAVAYRNACARRALPASCRPIVVEIQKAGAVAQTRVLALRGFVRANPTIDATALLVAAESAVDAFRQVSVVYQVGVQ